MFEVGLLEESVALQNKDYSLSNRRVTKNCRQVIKHQVQEIDDNGNIALIYPPGTPLKNSEIPLYVFPNLEIPSSSFTIF
jgi:hypothetical protein